MLTFNILGSFFIAYRAIAKCYCLFLYSKNRTNLALQVGSVPMVYQR